MIRKRMGRFTSMRGRTLFAIASLLVSIGALGMSSSAMATPKGAFAVFADCPVKTPEVLSCIFAKTESGIFTVGKKSVPIEKTIILQGGLKELNPTTLEFVGATDGNTLTKVPQKVPGGLSGLVNCTEIKGSGLIEKAVRASCEAIFENGLTGVTATTELAAPANSIKLDLGAIISASGTALSLPVKVHLENPLLGSSCYLGSNSAPIVIPFTTGTTSPPPPNKPISGFPGEFEGIEEGLILKVNKNSLVNNSFAAPKTNGCGGVFEFLIGPIINSQLGVPAEAGTNTAILNGTLEQTAASSVIEHE